MVSALTWQPWCMQLCVCSVCSHTGCFKPRPCSPHSPTPSRLACHECMRPASRSFLLPMLLDPPQCRQPMIGVRTWWVGALPGGCQGGGTELGWQQGRAAARHRTTRPVVCCKTWCCRAAHPFSRHGRPPQIGCSLPVLAGSMRSLSQQGPSIPLSLTALPYHCCAQVLSAITIGVDFGVSQAVDGTWVS